MGKEDKVAKTDTILAAAAIIMYNRGYYKNQRNVDLDRYMQSKFINDSAEDKMKRHKLKDLLHETATKYGGMEGYDEKDIEEVCDQIAGRIEDNIDYFKIEGKTVKLINITDEDIKQFVSPFLNTKPINPRNSSKRSKNWIVLASKFLHFWNHDAFPIMDRHSKKYYGIDDRDYVEQYWKCVQKVKNILHGGETKWNIPLLRLIDGQNYQGDIKMIDKIAYIIGKLEAL